MSGLPHAAGVALKGSAWLTLVLLMVPAAGLAEPARQQDREELIGTFQIRPAAHGGTEEPGSGRSGAPLMASPPSQHGYADPVQLYEDALDELNSGHRQTARDLFERLIDRHPESDLAELARRRLIDLDRERSLSTNRPDAPREATPEAPRGGAAAAIAEKFRAEVGDRIFFGPGSADLGARARAALAAQAQWLMKWPFVEATIEGHADEPGTDQDNLSLSAKRAEAVRLRLISEGVNGRRLGVVALGREQPIAICEDSDCRAQNRRAVTIVFVPNSKDKLGSASDRDAVATAPDGPLRGLGQAQAEDGSRMPR